jgi:hypothetical protein
VTHPACSSMLPPVSSAATAVLGWNFGRDRCSGQPTVPSVLWPSDAVESQSANQEPDTWRKAGWPDPADGPHHSKLNQLGNTRH